MVRCRFARWCLAVVLLGPLAARGDPPVPRGEPPTPGVAIPGAPIVGEAEATAVEQNPAGLPFLGGWSLKLVHAELAGGGLRGGRGDGLYFAARVPYLDQLAVGAALQLVRPPTSFPFGDLGKVSLALAYRPLPQLAVGFTWSYVVLPGSPGVDGIQTLDLGAEARLGRWLAVGLAVRDLFSTKFEGVPLQRVYEPELLLRPLGDDRLELAVAARFGERRGDVDPRFRLSSVVAPGVVLRGAVELKRDVDGDRRADNDVRATLGLELNLSRFGLGAYGLFGGNLGGSYLHGATFTARVSGDRYPALWEPRRFERIDLAATGDRARVALVTRLHRLAADPRLEGVVVVLGDVSGGWATMEELRGALLALRDAGKRVFAFGADVSTKAYYVATAAERIYLAPGGGVRLVGLSQTGTYLRGSFDLLGVQADYVKIAEYKSAPEQYTRTGPSPEALEVRNATLDDVYGRLVAVIAQARKLDGARVREIIDQGPYAAAGAQRVGLVDHLVDGDQVEDRLGDLVGHRVDAMAPDGLPRHPRAFFQPRLAILFVDGDIVEGKSMTIPLLDRRLAGMRTLLGALAEARSDPQVKAIVLRVDSPGGSALASDLIAREVARTRKVKPVVCSFGDIAASGGYYVAAGCERIFASPSTVTGSIGIFTGKFDLSGLAGKLGVATDTRKRGAHADMESLFRPYTDEERKLIGDQLRYFYDRFVGTVAQGRKLAPEAVDKVARGRVWTGAQALRVKLVDELGGIQAAIDEAKRQARLSPREPVELRAYPAEPSTLLGQLGQLLGISLGADHEPSLLAAPLGALWRGLPASLLVAPSTPQARLPYDALLDE